MPRRAASARTPWESRFDTPTLSRLLAGLSREHASLVTHARKALLAAAPGPETIAWQGLPWRWAILMWGDSTVRPWAYIVPQPQRPRLALPLHVDLLATLREHSLSRYARTGLAAAPRVGSICWAEWDLESPEQTAELIAIASRQFEPSLATVA